VRLTGQITASLVLGTIVTFATVGFLTLWMVDRIDRQAAADIRTMLDGAGRATSSQLVRTTIDYGWWDEGYHAFLRDDTDWLQENMGSGAEDTGVADLVLVADAEGRLRHGWAAPGLPPPAQEDFARVIDSALFALKDVPLDPHGGRTLVERAAGGLVFAGAARLSPTDGSVPDATTLPLVILATYITPERLQDYGGFYLVNDLAMVDAPPPGLDFKPVNDVRGDPLAYLAWTAPTPSRDVLLELALPMVFALLVFIGAMLLIASRAHHMARALSRAARKDYLTGLDNRKGLGDFLARPDVQSALAGGRVAALCADLDDFKRVNDTVGHRGGDAVVRVFAERLRSVLPPGARLVRMGGNACLALLVDGDAVSVAPVADAVQRIVADPFLAEGVEFHLGLSVGYAAGAPGIAAEALIDRADTAMYAAKRARTGRPVPHDASMESDAVERARLEARLRTGLANDELRLVYQPIIRLGDMTVDSLEALIRWRSPEAGDVSPERLIAVAEQSGLIRDVGTFVFNRVCEDLRRWSDMKVSVNLSPAELLDETIVPRIAAILSKHGVPPGQVSVELTETVLLDDPPAAARRLGQLRESGVPVALDDFGVGFASIGSLRSFPIDRLKVDRSFVAGIAASDADRRLLKAFLEVARAIDVPVVCEGIETELQAAIVREFRCEAGQGYLFSRPLEADEMEARLRSGWRFEGGTQIAAAGGFPANPQP
jgi:diguanylate cyclase (GGDEF)-like protein